jgi:hypothetical protein
MASPPEIQKLLDKLEAAYKKLGETNPFKNFNASAFNDVNDAISVLNDGLSVSNEKLSFLDDDLSKISAGFKSIVDSIKTQNQALNLSARGFNNLSSLAQKLKNDQIGISELNKKDLENLKKKAYEERANLSTAKEILKNKEKENNITDKEKATLNEINALLQGQDGLFRSLVANANARIVQEEKINKLMGLGGAAVEGTQKALNKMGFGGLSNALGLDEVKKKMRETAEEIEKLDGNANSFANKFKVLKGGIKEAGQQLITSLKDPLVVVGFLVDQMFDALQKADTQAGQLAKAFGTSYSEATSLRGELNTIASLSGDVNMTTNALQESLIALNKEFGTAGMLNKGLLEDFTNMTKVIGYSNEAAIKLGTISQATGTDLSDNTAEILGTAKAFNITNDLALNEKEIVEGVAKASASVTLSLGMQPGKIAAAVAQAKSLGLELEQVEKISESLLNFESSISNELEAELLTNRELNLEQARYYALTGDIEGVAKEIAKQNITAAEFGKMNMIARKSIASSLGMEADELGKALITQEALSRIKVKDEKAAKEKFDQLVKTYGYEKAVKELGDEQYGNQLKSQSIQERFTASVEKLKEIFVTLAEPLLAGLNKVMNVITKIVASFEKIKGVVKSLIGDKASSALGSLASVATIGSLTYALGKFLLSSITRGTEMNPTVVRLKGGIPGTGGGSEGGSEGGGGEGIPSFGKKASMGKQLKTLIKNPKAMTRALRRSGGGSILKGLTKGLTKAGGGIASLAGGFALDAITAKQIAEADELQQAGKIKEAENARSIGKVTDIGSAALTGAGLGGTIGSSFFGIGAVPGAVIGGALGAGYGAYQNYFANPDLAEDFIMRPGQKPLKFKEDDIIIGGTNLFGNTAQSTSPSISVDIAPLVNEMQAVKAVLVQILNKDSNVYMDGAKVGKGINMARTKIG